jgi:hypothetical protein
VKLAKRAIAAKFGQQYSGNVRRNRSGDRWNLNVIVVIFSHKVSIFILQAGIEA